MLSGLSFLEDDLKAQENQLEIIFKESNVPLVQEIGSYIISTGGKRVRPLLFLLLCKIFDIHHENRFKIGASLEYIHTASLLHDDVIDHAEYRRNKPTVASKWDPQKAILVGDFIFAQACKILGEIPNPLFLTNASNCIAQMSAAEILQQEFLFKYDVSEKEIYQIITGKTAKLFSITTAFAPLLANKSKEIINNFEEIGYSLGIIFQLIDDLLDINGNPKEVGKPIFADIEEGKITLPVLWALQENPEGDLSKSIKKIFAQKKMSPQEKKHLRIGINKTSAQQKTQNIIKENELKIKDLLNKSLQIENKKQQQALTLFNNILKKLSERKS